MSVAVINGKAYDSADVEVMVLGKPILEVTEISYDKDVDHQLNYGMRAKPTSYSKGKESYSASLGLMMHEVVGIEDSIQTGDKDLTAIKPFQIMVSYLHESGKIVTDKIYAKFKNHGREVNGEMGLSKVFELFVLDIKFNV